MIVILRTNLISQKIQSTEIVKTKSYSIDGVERIIFHQYSELVFEYIYKILLLLLFVYDLNFMYGNGKAGTVQELALPIYYYKMSSFLKWDININILKYFTLQ